MSASFGISAREAAEGLRQFDHAVGGDPYGVRTVAGAKAAYVRGDIEIDEYERRVEALLRGERVAAPQGQRIDPRTLPGHIQFANVFGETR